MFIFIDKITAPKVEVEKHTHTHRVSLSLSMTKIEETKNVQTTLMRFCLIIAHFDRAQHNIYIIYIYPIRSDSIGSDSIRFDSMNAQNLPHAHIISIDASVKYPIVTVVVWFCSFT